MEKGYIQLTNKTFSFDKVGDILKVNRFGGHGAYVLNKDLPRPQRYMSSNDEWCYLNYDYEILENYKGGNMTKKDLKNGDIVTLRNGDRLAYANECIGDLSDDNDNPIYEVDQFNDDLTHYIDEKEYDIIKVERPVEYETVFTRDDAVELTVDEISEKLGYKVKVVGEDR